MLAPPQISSWVTFHWLPLGLTLFRPVHPVLHPCLVFSVPNPRLRQKASLYFPPVPTWNAEIQDTIGWEQSYILFSRCPWRWCCKMEFWGLHQCTSPSLHHHSQMPHAFPGLGGMVIAAAKRGKAQKSVRIQSDLIPRSAEEACPVP